MNVLERTKSSIVYTAFIEWKIFRKYIQKIIGILAMPFTPSFSFLPVFCFKEGEWLKT
jgi:hypothetical protein